MWGNLDSTPSDGSVGTIIEFFYKASNRVIWRYFWSFYADKLAKDRGK